MKNPPQPPAKAARNPVESLVHEALEQATTRVEPGLLARSGIANVRILTESNFLKLLPSMIESSLDKGLEATRKDLLSRIEERVQRLADTFEEIEQALERLEEKGLRRAPGTGYSRATSRSPRVTPASFLKSMLFARRPMKKA